jgi:hypothetical protein
MAYLNDDAVWEKGVRQLEEEDDCVAGVFNEPLGQLTRRTKHLKDRIEDRPALGEVFVTSSYQNPPISWKGNLLTTRGFDLDVGNNHRIGLTPDSLWNRYRLAIAAEDWALMYLCSYYGDSLRAIGMMTDSSFVESAANGNFQLFDPNTTFFDEHFFKGYGGAYWIVGARDGAGLICLRYGDNETFAFDSSYAPVFVGKRGVVIKASENALYFWNGASDPSPLPGYGYLRVFNFVSVGDIIYYGDSAGILYRLDPSSIPPSASQLTNSDITTTFSVATVPGSGDLLALSAVYKGSPSILLIRKSDMGVAKETPCGGRPFYRAGPGAFGHAASRSFIIYGTKKKRFVMYNLASMRFRESDASSVVSVRFATPSWGGAAIGLIDGVISGFAVSSGTYVMRVTPDEEAGESDRVEAPVNAGARAWRATESRVSFPALDNMSLCPRTVGGADYFGYLSIKRP